MLEIEIKKEPDFVICRPSGDLDAYTVSKFRTSLADVEGAECLIIDLCGVPFMDSAGLGALISGIRKSRDNENKVAVVSDRPAITRLLHTTGFDRLVSVVSTIEEAAQEFKSEPESS